MNLSPRHAALASVVTAMMFAAAPTASAQTAGDQDAVNQRPSQQDCVNPQDCPNVRNRVEQRDRTQRRDRAERRERRNDQAQRENRARDRAERREERRAENRNWRFDRNRHERRRDRNDRFRFYFNGFWYPEPYWQFGLPVAPGRISCGQGREELRLRGYRRINTIECRGRTYTYTARRNGIPYRLLVSARTGNVIDRDRL